MSASSSENIESSVIIVWCQPAEQFQIVAVKLAGVHDQDRNIGKVRLQCFQQGMYPHEGEYITHAGQHQYVTALVRLVLNLIYELAFSNR